MGKNGLPAVAKLCLQKAHYLADALQQINGIKPVFPGSFFKEFAVTLPVEPGHLIKKMREEKIFAGIDLSRFDYGLENSLLIAVTEKRSRQEMDRYVELIQKITG
jgi:glycine dehydrogenase subunit 1